MKVSREQHEWRDDSNEMNRKEGRGRKERKRGCQYIGILSGHSYTEHFSDLSSQA